MQILALGRKKSSAPMLLEANWVEWSLAEKDLWLLVDHKPAMCPHSQEWRDSITQGCMWECCQQTLLSTGKPQLEC